jgi:hypothetical protein
VIVAYVDAFKSRFGVEPICRVLTEHDVPIAPSTYYASKRRLPCARQRRDGMNLKLVHDLHREDYGAYGVRKLWHAMRHERSTVGRDPVARLMRLAGLRGHVRRQRVRTTIATIVTGEGSALEQAVSVWMRFPASFVADGWVHHSDDRLSPGSTRCRRTGVA